MHQHKAIKFKKIKQQISKISTLPLSSLFNHLKLKTSSSKNADENEQISMSRYPINTKFEINILKFINNHLTVNCLNLTLYVGYTFGIDDIAIASI